MEVSLASSPLVLTNYARIPNSIDDCLLDPEDECIEKEDRNPLINPLKRIKLSKKELKQLAIRGEEETIEDSLEH